MELFMYSVIMLILLFLVYYLYKRHQLEKEKLRELDEFLKKKEYSKTSKKSKIDKIQVENEPLYNLNTHKIKYSVYPSNSEYASFLYNLVVIKNYWINEPFHSKFFEFLLLIDNNNFMIIDSNSKVITMNLRDNYNKVQTSKSYQVYSTKDIIKHLIADSMKYIDIFSKNDAQNILLSIFVFVLEKSVHYLSHDIPSNTITNILKNYEDSEKVNHFSKLINDKSSQLFFIDELFHNALNYCNTFPYNDSEVAIPIKNSLILQKKVLRNI